MSQKSRIQDQDSLPGTQTFLVAYGKHPGWDDHIESLGTFTDQLVDLKRQLYLEGIERNIGAWEQLDDKDFLEQFDHSFVRFNVSNFIVGRMWSSTDGKGRSKYPMIICAQCCQVDIRREGDAIFDILERVESRSKEAASAEEVKAIIVDMQRVLQEKAEEVWSSVPEPPLPQVLSQLADHHDMQAQQHGIHRVLFFIQREILLFSSGRAESRVPVDSLRPLHLRVPQCANTAKETVLLWFDLLRSFVREDIPLNFFVPQGELWLEIIVGEPGSKELFSLKASLEKIPSVHEIPYEQYGMDETFIAEVDDLVTHSREGECHLKEWFQNQKNSSASAPKKKSAAKPLGLLFLVLCLIVLVVLWIKYFKDSRATSPPSTHLVPVESPEVSSVLDDGQELFDVDDDWFAVFSEDV